MLRFLAVALAGAFVLGAGASEKPRLTKNEYLAAVTRITTVPEGDRLEAQVVDFDLPGGWPDSRETWLRSERRLRASTEHVADQVGALRPPAEVADAQAAFVESLRLCARSLAQLERLSPLDAVIAERELQPCLAAHRRACDKYYAHDYSWG